MSRVSDFSVTSVSPTHPWNALCPIDERASGKVIADSFVQFWNAKSSMTGRLLPIDTLSSVWQLRNGAPLMARFTVADTTGVP